MHLHRVIILDSKLCAMVNSLVDIVLLTIVPLEQIESMTVHMTGSLYLIIISKNMSIV